MHTWIVIALVGSVAPSVSPSTPVWHSDYGVAREKAMQQNKPLVVVVGTGANGWKNVAQDGSIDGKALQHLAQDYVCVYADRATDTGKQIAQALEISSKAGLVISDREAKLQAFSNDGTLTGADLNKTLDKFADKSVKVVTTETVSHVNAVPVQYIGTSCVNGKCSAATYTISNCANGNCASAPVVIQGSCSSGSCPTTTHVPSSCSNGSCGVPTKTYIRSSCPNGRCPR